MFGRLAGVMFGLVLLKDSREEVSMMNNVKQCGLSHLTIYKIIFKDIVLLLIESSRGICYGKLILTIYIK